MSEALHPLPPALLDILTNFASLRDQVLGVTVHYPELGKRRPFRSLGDVMAYEAGYLAFDANTAGPQIKTPFAHCWWDAAAEHDAKGDEDGGVTA